MSMSLYVKFPERLLMVGKDVPLVDDSSIAVLKDGVTMHVELAKSLFNRHLLEEVELLGGFFEIDSNESIVEEWTILEFFGFDFDDSP